ncbi:MAG TPA: Cys-tRNA(Pro) deacylase [Mycobacteriales bacterium]|jgi:Cys-tRNA(Pro)/Cys-tRNA(Cys) deacylase|nr:Cys-tRNA(Pro) deacylase [Mycobacteriales bacterium]
MPAAGTPALALLARAGVAHTVHAYEHDPRATAFGDEAAEALGIDPARLFKTLVVCLDGGKVDGGKLAVAVVPVAGSLDLKGCAAILGGKRAVLADQTEAERATGYVRGGISPLGARKRLPVVLDESASAFPTIFISAGRRGLQVELAPADLIRLSAGTLAAIAAP